MLSDDQQSSIVDLIKTLAIFDPRDIKVKMEGEADVLVTFNMTDGRRGRKDRLMFGSWIEKNGKWQYGWRIVDNSKEKIN